MWTKDDCFPLPLFFFLAFSFPLCFVCRLSIFPVTQTRHKVIKRGGGGMPSGGCCCCCSSYDTIKPLVRQAGNDRQTDGQQQQQLPLAPQQEVNGQCALRGCLSGRPPPPPSSIFSLFFLPLPCPQHRRKGKETDKSPNLDWIAINQQRRRGCKETPEREATKRKHTNTKRR